MTISLSLSKRQILDSSKLNDFADDSFEFDENGRKFSKRVENTVGKGEIALFPQCFHKTNAAGFVEEKGYQLSNV